MSGDDVVEDSALVGDADDRPELAITGDRDEDNREVAGGHESEVHCNLREPVPHISQREAV